MRTTLSRGHASLLFLGVLLLLASCGKEVVEPCQRSADGSAEKSMIISSDPGQWQGASTTSGGDNSDDGKGSTIGDDGDDLADTERGRRKKAS